MRTERTFGMTDGAAGIGARGRAALARPEAWLVGLIAIALVVGCGEPGRGERAGGEATPGGKGGDSASASESRTELWLCPMHPTYVVDHKGDCPICGMDLVPAAEFAAQQGGGVSSVPGMATVYLSGDAIRLAGVRTQPAETRSMELTIRTSGIVTADEARVRRVQTKVSGWVEKLHINRSGQAVRRGEPLLSIYSPELLAGQEEFVRALETRDRGGTSAEILVEAARERLRLLDVPPRALEELERTRQPSRAVVLTAPVSGTLTAREVYEGMKVEPGMELLTVADFSTVWIEAPFYEYEARGLSEGQPADLRLPYDPSVALSGEIDFIYPYLDDATRTVRARLVFANDFGLLKPGMYADVTVRIDQGEALTIPDNAILDTGERQIVFVHRGGGDFEPRSVEVGARSGGLAQIYDGLAEGEEVVVRANFLLDSESRIRAALAGLGATTPKAEH